MTDPRRHGMPKQVARLLPALARKAYRKYGFAESAVLIRWREIVGASLAQRCAPTRLAFQRGRRGCGTLHVMAEGPAALELQHMEPLVIERINAFYGYSAVSRLSVTQAPLPLARPSKQPRPAARPDQSAQTRLDRQLADLHNDGLKSALSCLGTSMLGQLPDE